jgi:glycolate oxidase FAD binding subunit
VPLLERLRAAVGPDHVLTGVELSPYLIEGRTPEAAVFPGSVDEVAAVIAQAAEAGVPVVPWGGGTAVGVGVPPARAGVVLVLARLGAILEHEPGDLTATAQAGVTLAALQTALRARGQWLSLDPPDAARATLGGALAANASGPRRHLYGTARDLLIGVTVVTGEGVVVRGGGKVVKNVAGYDLPKLFIGSFGTLGVIVEATVKLRPLPDEERLVAVRFERLKDAGAAVRALLSSDLIPNAVDLVDAAAGAALGLAPAPATLAVGFDGLGEQVDWQVAQLAAVVAPCGGAPPTPLPSATWDRLASAARDAFDAPAAVMTLSVLPSAVAATMEQGAEAARQRGLASAWCAHAGVGYLTAALRAEGERADAAPVAAVLADWRAAAHAGGGHASVTWAPRTVKSALPVWDDAGAPARLMQRIKAQLDPNGVLNPGRFVGGI